MPHRAWIAVALIGTVLIGGAIYSWNSRDSRMRFLAFPCKSVLIKLKNTATPDWDYRCEDNILHARVRVKGTISFPAGIRPFLYRELANQMLRLAQASPRDSLENVAGVVLRLDHEMGSLVAAVKGKDLADCLEVRMDTQLLAEHIARTVKVKEVSPL